MPDALARARQGQIDALVRVGVDPEDARLHVDAVLIESAAGEDPYPLAIASSTATRCR